MTTLLYDRSIKTIAVDSKNSDNAGQVFLCNKIEELKDGRIFLGSGHLLTIGKARRWAEVHFREDDRPEFGEIFVDESGEFGFSCLIISKDGERVWLLDDEMEPIELLDSIIAVGSGGIAAKAARLAGASMERAVEIAIMIDNNSGGPVVTRKLI